MFYLITGHTGDKLKQCKILLKKERSLYFMQFPNYHLPKLWPKNPYTSSLSASNSSLACYNRKTFRAYRYQGSEHISENFNKFPLMATLVHLVRVQNIWTHETYFKHIGNILIHTICSGSPKMRFEDFVYKNVINCPISAIFVHFARNKNF